LADFVKNNGLLASHPPVLFCHRRLSLPLSLGSWPAAAAIMDSSRPFPLCLDSSMPAAASRLLAFFVVAVVSTLTTSSTDAAARPNASTAVPVSLFDSSMAAAASRISFLRGDFRHFFPSLTATASLRLASSLCLLLQSFVGNDGRRVSLSRLVLFCRPTAAV
jgi:hypothetical protein